MPEEASRGFAGRLNAGLCGPTPAPSSTERYESNGHEAACHPAAPEETSSDGSRSARLS